VPPFEVLRALEFPPEGIESHGIRFRAIPVYETPEKLPGDEVTIIHFVADGLHIVFLGDLGHSLSEAELAPIRGADIVLAAAGGPPTIDFPEIPPLLDAIGPKVVIPMHFKTPKINLNIQPVERFLEALPNDPVQRLESCSIQLDRASLPDRRTIVVLEHLR
jgi:L-ascorbate metabolism protein UlaG (beta-lactamase superfamily)